MKRRIEYEWWNVDDKRSNHDDHQNELAEEAEARIFDMLKEGFNEGELHATLTDENDKEYTYRGWWDIITVD